GRIGVCPRGRARSPPAATRGLGGGLPEAGARRPHGHEDDDMLDHLAEDGRGLLLVDALAARWGTRAALAGRLVWADL
ncbi:ATP-binding protein, partial [Streptomyces anulatus]